MTHRRTSFPVVSGAATPFRLLCLLTMLQAAPVHALTITEGCRPGDSLLLCRLQSVLTLLYTAAGILALLLVIAVVAAFLVYRRNAHKHIVKDVTSDAD